MMPTIALLALYLLPYQAQQPEKTTLGPGPLTFPQIAKALSVGDHRVECPKSLANRAALVFLKERSWDKAVRLLEDGLAIRLTPQSGNENSWTLERDPKVEARERDWQRRLLAGLRDQLNRKIEAYGALNQTYPEVYRRYEEARARIDEARKEDTAEGGPSARTRELISEARWISATTTPQGWVAGRVFSQGLKGDLSAVLKGDTIYRPVDPSSLEDRESIAAVWAVAATERAALSGENPGKYRLDDLRAKYTPPSDFAAYVSVGFSRMFFGLEINAALYGEGKLMLPNGLFASMGPIGVDTLFRGYQAPQPERSYAGLGSDACQWLDAQRKQTVAFLASGPAGEKIAVPAGPPVTSISAALELWAVQSGHEVVMEMNPLRESLIVSSQSMPELLPGSHPALAQVLKPDGWWALRQQDGVLLADDLAAFADRLLDYPLPALLALENTRKSHPDRRGPGYEMEDALSYASSVTLAQNGALRDLWKGEYRGQEVGKLAAAYPILRLVHSLPRSERDRMIETVKRGEDYVVTLSKQPASLTRALADAWRQFDPKNVLFLRPDFAEILRACRVKFSASTEDDGPDRKLLRCSLEPVGQVADWMPFDVFERFPLCFIPG